jgi:hypothetical protein
LYGAGNATFGGTLAASGAVTVGGATTLNNTLYGAGNATFGTTLAASGAVAFGSTLNVDGATTLNNTLSVTGTGAFDNALIVGGAILPKTGISWMDIGSSAINIPVAIRSTSVYIGANPNGNILKHAFSITSPTVASGLSDPTVISMNGKVNVSNDATFDGTLSASGAVAFGNTLTVDGDTTLSGVLRGPSAFVIDPSLYNDDTGTVIIRGNLLSNGTLAASGAVTVGGATTLKSTLYGAGAATFGTTLAASGAVTVGGATTLNNTLYGAGAATFGTTLAASGAVTVGGATSLKNTLSVGSAATFATTLAASGAVTVGGDLTIGGTFADTSLINNGATSKFGQTDGGYHTLTILSTKNSGSTVPGSVNVRNAYFNATHAATFSSTLSVVGATTLKGTLAASGAVAFGSTLAASGAVAFGSTLSVVGATTLNNTLYGAGNATFGGTLSASGAVAFGTTLSASGAVAFGSNLSVTGDTTLSGVLKGPSEFTIDPAGHGDVTGTVVILGNLRVQGETTTINSATLDVVDKNITVSKNSVIRADSNEAGLSIDLGYVSGASGPKDYATLIYESQNDNFRVNKLVRCGTGPVNVDDLTNKKYVDEQIVAAASTIAPNTIGLSLINGLKFKVISDTVPFTSADISTSENNILYIWNNGSSAVSINLPVPNGDTAEPVQVYKGVNMFAYSTVVGDEGHWTDSA